MYSGIGKRNRKGNRSNSKMNDKEKSSLEEWIGKKCDFKLLYEISQDGCSSQTFHTKCDNQGPTVTVVYNTNGSVFGGFTTQNWNTSGTFVSDIQAFLFRLRQNGRSNMKQYPLQANSNGDYAIYCDVNYGPTFGGGHDLLTFSYTANWGDYGDYFLLNGSCNIGNTFDNKGDNVNEITNGHMQVWVLEVYKVIINDALHVKDPKPLTEPWRDESKWEHKYRMYTVRHQGQPLNFRLCDTRGIEDDIGLDSQDICYILDGNISDRYQVSYKFYQ
ncbi:hypothetical protein FSP39_019853 [Pinctada imbricata]|uniref:TLDc domain-containing protein n=1 Tax=Pinctada imbricata TaxID=66713 RepID=A0AA88YEJ4_PINIB|nr:hypothetical protein FSP39_019853 [Pinctada imbricata]